jgi:acyl carrier protein phosphodiesterase
MNYLAHLALAYPDKELTIGNFIGDHVRDKDLDRFSKSIQEGVLMHRSIDIFTDNHSITKELRQILFREYRHLSRVLIDIYYDHFLAVHFTHLYGEDLSEFIINVQALLQQEKEILPDTAQRYLTGMVSQDWLTAYAHITGIDSVLSKMAKRSGLEGLASGIDGLKNHYEILEKGFMRFYPELILFCFPFKKNNIG